MSTDVSDSTCSSWIPTLRPTKTPPAAFPILSMPACVRLAHHDPSPSRSQPSSCSAIPWLLSFMGYISVSQKGLLTTLKMFLESGLCLPPSSTVSQMVANCPLTGSLPPWLPELCPLYQNVSSTMGEIFACVATASQVWSMILIHSR